MARKFLVPIVAVLAAMAALVGTVPTAAAAGTLTPVSLRPDPILLTYSGPPPHGCPGNPTICYLPIPVPTLTLQARMGVPGETVVFSIGAKPTPVSPRGSIVICSTVTDSAGHALCNGGRPTPAVLLALLTGGGWVSHPATDQYGFAVAQMPLVQQVCDNPFC